jgi:hypothetical protein
VLAGGVRQLVAGQHSCDLSLSVGPAEAGNPGRRAAAIEDLLNPKMTVGTRRHLRQMGDYEHLIGIR